MLGATDAGVAATVLLLASEALAGVVVAAPLALVVWLFKRYLLS